MNCPICNVSLLLSDKQGIEIDYCPKCRGIWLDRGELEKIIERSASYDTAPSPARVIRSEHDHHDYRHGKKKSFLSELFD